MTIHLPFFEFLLLQPISIVFMDRKIESIKDFKRIEEKYMGPHLYWLDSKMADDINNLSLGEPQNENENLDEELINELKGVISDCDNVNDLVKIIEKYTRWPQDPLNLINYGIKE